MAGDVDAAATAAASATASALETESSILVTYAHTFATGAALLAGDVAEATGRLELARRSMREREAPRITTLVAIYAFSLATRRGKAELPWVVSFNEDELLELAFRSQEPWWIGNLVSALVEWRAQSQQRGSEILLGRAVGAVASIALCPRFPLTVAARGSAEDVARVRQLVVRWAASPQNDFGRACLKLFDALVARRNDEPVGEQAHEAAIEFARLRVPLLYARALEVAGKIDEAAFEYRLCGSSVDARRLTRASPAISTGRLRDALSAREREVTDVLLKGYANREIADLLHISERTVESHVRTILSKVGVRSRFELAMALVEGEESGDGDRLDSVPAG
jgi:DNA-binding CsgD family transcriptional regulator